MSKNLVLMQNVKFGGKTKREYEYSIKSWRAYCKKYGHQHMMLEDPIQDLDYMGIIWQRYFLFDLLDANDVEYDQILMVDADTIIHPDAPDVFELTDGKWSGVYDTGNFDWICRTVENYNLHLFPDEKPFSVYNYFNSGFQIINKTHRPFFDTMRQFYDDNAEKIRWCQKTFMVGTDQTPLNYMLRRENIARTVLPHKWNMSCMYAKECVNEQMQHTRAGYVMHFNGIPNKDEMVPYWMEKTYNYLYG